MFGFFNNKVFDKGYLPEFEGHEIYYQQMGNPKGEPVLFFHGGPGGSCKDSHGNYFNLKSSALSCLTSAAADAPKPKTSFP